MARESKIIDDFRREWFISSMESWVWVLYDALAAASLDHSVSLEADLALLDVELGEAAAVRGHGLHTLVCDHLAAPEAEFPEAGQSRGQHLEPGVSDVTFPDVETPEAGAAAGDHLEGGVTDGLAASEVEVSQLVAVTSHRRHTAISDEAALGGGEVTEPRAQPGQLQQRGVSHPGAVRDTQLPQHEAVGRHHLDPRVWNESEEWARR